MLVPDLVEGDELDELKRKAVELDALLAAAKPVVDRFYSDAEGEEEWATFQDEIVHLGDVIDEVEKL